MSRSKKIYYLLFVCIIFALCLVPSVGMLWDQSEPVDSTTQTPLPVIVEEGGTPNVFYAAEMGDYFETHFAYRPYAIDLNARIRVGLFQTSPTDQVIVGTDGWLYYGGTLSDYLGKTVMTAREAKNIAHNLSLVQRYTAAKGAQFTFTIAPNKNSLYPSHMPYYYLAGENRNRSLLKSQLDAYSVNYIDLFAELSSVDQELYYHTDSHWNSEGALVAAEALLDSVSAQEAIVKQQADTAHDGDIEAMLHPVTAEAENTTTLSTGSWEYTESAASVKDSFIRTTSDSGSGSLLMFRDSFGDALIPLLSPSFSQSYYSKLIPYNFYQMDTLKPDCVVIERAERHVSYIAENPPIMAAPQIQAQSGAVQEKNVFLDRTTDGNYVVFSGWIADDTLTPEDEILLQITPSSGSTTTVVPFYKSMRSSSEQSNDYGFQVYYPKNLTADGPFSVSVLTAQKNTNGRYDNIITVKAVIFD